MELARNTTWQSSMPMAKVNMQAIRDAGLRVVLDPMYGVGEKALSTILISGRCDLEVIHQEHDTLFGGTMPAPSAELLHLLRTRVLAHSPK